MLNDKWGRQVVTDFRLYSVVELQEEIVKNIENSLNKNQMEINIDNKSISINYEIKILKIEARFENVIGLYSDINCPKLLVVTIFVSVPDRDTNEPINLCFTTSSEFWPYQKIEKEIKRVLLTVLEHELDEQLFLNGKRIKDPHV